MWHCGHVNMGSILTCKMFQIQLFVQQCKIRFNSIFSRIKIRIILRCQDGDTDDQTPILFTSECKYSKWSKPMRLLNGGKKVSKDTSEFLPYLKHYKCSFPVNKEQSEKYFCDMLKKVTVLTFFQDLFIKYFCQE